MLINKPTNRNKLSFYDYKTFDVFDQLFYLRVDIHDDIKPISCLLLLVFNLVFILDSINLIPSTTQWDRAYYDIFILKLTILFMESSLLCL